MESPFKLWWNTCDIKWTTLTSLKHTAQWCQVHSHRCVGYPELFHLAKLKLCHETLTLHALIPPDSHHATLSLWIRLLWGSPISGSHTLFAFRWLAYFTQSNVLRSSHVAAGFTWILVPCMSRPHFAYPFICGWTLGLLLPLGDCESPYYRWVYILQRCLWIVWLMKNDVIICICTSLTAIFQWTICHSPFVPSHEQTSSSWEGQRSPPLIWQRTVRRVWWEWESTSKLILVQAFHRPGLEKLWIIAFVLDSVSRIFLKYFFFPTNIL